MPALAPADGLARVLAPEIGPGVARISMAYRLDLQAWEMWGIAEAPDGAAFYTTALIDDEAPAEIFMRYEDVVLHALERVVGPIGRVEFKGPVAEVNGLGYPRKPW